MKAIIILHEIYGINRFIIARKERFQSLGFYFAKEIVNSRFIEMNLKLHKKERND